MDKQKVLARTIKETNGCWTPIGFSKSQAGYSKGYFAGHPLADKHQSVYLHRFMLYDKDPSGYFKGAQAAHQCHNPICINPDHLEWQTAYDNLKERNGFNWGMSYRKLTEDQVRQIRKLHDSGVPSTVIQQMLGLNHVTTVTVRNAANRKTFKEVV